jgi:hypothetical protein
MATPRSNCARALASHEVGDETLPSLSGDRIFSIPYRKFLYGPDLRRGLGHGGAGH